MDPEYLQLSDRQLLTQCEVHTYRASGPGGQKRNKTDSAVRLHHGPTGIISKANESRSQLDNRRKALWRLRQALAMRVREGVQFPEPYTCPAVLAQLFSKHNRPSTSNPDYLLGVRELMDVLAAFGGSVSDTAERIGVSTGALSRLITSDPLLQREVNQLRQQRGHKPLRQ